jgi:hypothetical protein
MTITTVTRQHNMHNNCNCIAHEGARLKTLQFVEHVTILILKRQTVIGKENMKDELFT